MYETIAILGLPEIIMVGAFVMAAISYKKG